MGEIFLANDNDLKQLRDIYEACSNDLLNKGLQQWDATYPNESHISYHIKEREMYVYKKDGTIVGAIVLNESQSPEWEAINWQSSNPFIIHMLCVDPTLQNGGVGKKLVQFAEKIAIEQGYQSIRLDSFSKNEKSLAFYRKAGYNDVGSITFTNKQEGDDRYICFEKVLNN
jgi:ribosomal protein S18 acetylase RimI-like enzyme